MSPDFLADPALGRVWDALPAARVVGGAVRDALAGRAVADFDLATPVAPEGVIAALRAAGIKVVPTGLAHGTVTAVVDGRPFEITTLRRDVATDGRHAVVAFTDDWQADASRRDFTINAMSMDRGGTVFDYFGGRADLAAGRVRFVGNPATRIAEDYLRVLRYFRFHARYGREPPDAVTLAALHGGIAGLGRLSAERVWMEIRRILAAPAPDGAVALMRALGVWQAVLPEAAGIASTNLVPADPVLRLATLLTAPDAAIAARLKLSNLDAARLARLAVTPVAGGPDDDLRRHLADYPKADLVDRLWIETARTGRPADATRARLEAMAVPVFRVQGKDVVAAGVAPGPDVGAALRSVRAWWLAGGCLADRRACLRRLQEWRNGPK